MRTLLLAAVLGLAIAGCSAGAADVTIPRARAEYLRDTPLPGATHAAFVIPRGHASPIFDLPWPTELRKKDGRPDFTGFPGEDASVVDEYVATAARDVDGYSVAPVVYFHFDAAIAEANLPRRAADTMSARSPVFLVDVDEASPDRGTFLPLTFRVFGKGMRFVPANVLAVKPVAGFVLRPGTLYAAVVARSLGDATGAPLGTTRDLEIVKNTQRRADANDEAARSLHASAFDQLERFGVPRDSVAAIALFRTQRPSVVTARMLDVTAHLEGASAPHMLRAEWVDVAAKSIAARDLDLGEPSYKVIRGYYCTPNFQGHVERAPYLDGGGEVALDATGAPLPQPVPLESPYRNAECGDLLRARFVLSIPNRPAPPGGYPLMLSAHGTGGNAFSFVGENNFAGWAASAGIAVVSTDQPIHGADDPDGARPGSREPMVVRLGGFPLPIPAGKSVAEIGFYNPLHPGAARDNLRQAVVDAFVLLHLVARTDFATAKGAAGAPLLAARTPMPRFDATRLIYAGHSQGSQSAAVLGALDAATRAVVLSGCGGDARLGIVRRRDLKIMPLVGALLGAEPGELDEFHPLLALVQTLADPIDPESYARAYWEGGAAQRSVNVLHFEGTSDTFTPPETSEALSIALHAAQVGAVVRPVEGLELLHLKSGVASLSGNAGNGRATIGFTQFASTHNENGHFVLYRETGAGNVLRTFLKTSLDGPATISRIGN